MHYKNEHLFSPVPAFLLEAWSSCILHGYGRYLMLWNRYTKMSHGDYIKAELMTVEILCVFIGCWMGRVRHMGMINKKVDWHKEGQNEEII